jgi:hypothetical protein
MNELTQEQALEQINAMEFPVVEEGDIASHEGYNFIYQSGEWIIKPE